MFEDKSSFTAAFLFEVIKNNGYSEGAGLRS